MLYKYVGVASGYYGYGNTVDEARGALRKAGWRQVHSAAVVVEFPVPRPINVLPVSGPSLVGQVVWHTRNYSGQLWYGALTMLHEFTVLVPELGCSTCGERRAVQLEFTGDQKLIQCNTCGGMMHTEVWKRSA